MPDLYVIKLGGSVITAKELNQFEVREETLARIALEIRKAMEEGGFKLIVVHGAGPFGHTNVAKYGINEGVFTPEQKAGLAKTIRDCNFLNSRVVANLQAAGIPAVGFDSDKLASQENKKLSYFDTSPVEKALAKGKVPVLYGQMVTDRKLVASVLSGDTIIAHLAEKLRPKKVLIGTDVAGVFTADPKKEMAAERIPEINKENFEAVLSKVQGASAVDVTQGMRGKLLKLREQLSGVPAVIFNANEAGVFYRALRGEAVEGTEIHL